MNINSPILRKTFPKGLVFLMVIVLVLGVFFRFVNFDKKIAWIDERITSVRISNYYTKTELEQQILGGQVISLDDLQRSQRLNPQTNVVDVIRNSFVNSAEHPPLYYILSRLAAERFGNSIVVTRGVSAVISLFVFPCIYWLCWELFGSSFLGWVGVALMAISPFHVLYAQEARAYSLWTVATLLTSAALLRALRVNTKLSWITYAATLAFGFYSHLFFLLVAFTQGVYIVIFENFRLSKSLVAYLLAATAGLLAFSPWLWIIVDSISHLKSATSWNTQQPTLLSLLKRWVGNLSRVFIDFGFDENLTLTSAIILIPLIISILILVGYSIYFISRKAPKRAWLFVLTLTLIPFAALVVMDLISGKILSGTARYLVPSYVGVQLAVIYLIATKTTIHSTSIRQKNIWRIISIALFTLGVLSCTLSSQATVWWNKGEAKELTQVAHLINQAPQPLLVSDDDLARILSIGYLLEPKVRLQLVLRPNMPDISDNFSDVFLFNPSSKMRQALEREYKLKPLYNKELNLWKLAS